MASIARTALRSAALRPTTSSSSFASTTSAVASSSKLPYPSLSLARCNSTASTPSTSSTTTTADASDASDASSPTPVRYTYFVPRVGKTLSSLPVYTDVRNGGTRTMTELRKIQGNLADLKTDLAVFLAETYNNEPQVSPFKASRKPLKPKAGRRMVERTGNPSYVDPIQGAKVQASGKLKIRGNRVDEVRAFLESRGF